MSTQILSFLTFIRKKFEYLNSKYLNTKHVSKSNDKQRFQDIFPNQMKSNVSKAFFQIKWKATFPRHFPNQMKSNVSIDGFQLIFLLMDFNSISINDY